MCAASEHDNSERSSTTTQQSLPSLSQESRNESAINAKAWARAVKEYTEKNGFDSHVSTFRKICGEFESLGDGTRDPINKDRSASMQRPTTKKDQKQDRERGRKKDKKKDKKKKNKAKRRTTFAAPVLDSPESLPFQSTIVQASHGLLSSPSSSSPIQLDTSKDLDVRCSPSMMVTPCTPVSPIAPHKTIRSQTEDSGTVKLPSDQRIALQSSPIVHDEDDWTPVRSGEPVGDNSDLYFSGPTELTHKSRRSLRTSSITPVAFDLKSSKLGGVAGALASSDLATRRPDWYRASEKAGSRESSAENTGQQAHGVISRNIPSVHGQSSFDYDELSDFAIDAEDGFENRTLNASGGMPMLRSFGRPLQVQSELKNGDALALLRSFQKTSEVYGAHQERIATSGPTKIRCRNCNKLFFWKDSEAGECSYHKQQAFDHASDMWICCNGPPSAEGCCRGRHKIDDEKLQSDSAFRSEPINKQLGDISPQTKASASARKLLKRTKNGQ